MTTLQTSFRQWIKKTGNPGNVFKSSSNPIESNLFTQMRICPALSIWWQFNSMIPALSVWLVHWAINSTWTEINLLMMNWIEWCWMVQDEYAASGRLARCPRSRRRRCSDVGSADGCSRSSDTTRRHGGLVPHSTIPGTIFHLNLILQSIEKYYILLI